MLQIEQKKKMLTKNSASSTNKNTDDDDDNNVAMHIKKTHNNQPNCGAHLSNNVE